ncbi:hypothetical protein REPUB_Repub11eG0116200 [Reevesia pubescens]
MSSATKTDSRYTNPKTRVRSLPPRSLHPDRFSEFSESLRRQGHSTSTKFLWNHLLPDNSAAAASAAVELAMQNERAATTTYSMSSPMGIGFIDSMSPHLKDMTLGFINNDEDFRYPRYPDVENMRGMIGFGGYGENLGFDSCSVISEMARNRIRRTEEVTELAYRKEALRARASAIDSIIDKIDGAVENGAIEQKVEYMTGQKKELLHGKQREDCSHNQCYIVGEGEEVVGFRMNHHPQSPKRGPVHGELGSAHVFPYLFNPDSKENSHRNEKVQENEVLGCWLNRRQSQNGAVFLGESQQFQQYVNLSGKSHVMKQENEDFDSKMNCNKRPKRAPLHKEDYPRSLPREYLGFLRELHVKEQTNDVSSSCMNPPEAEKRALLNGGRPELSEDHFHSLPQHYLDFNVESHETQQEDELLQSRMNHSRKRNEALSHGEKQQMQEDSSRSLPQYHLGLNGEAHVMEQETEVLASRMNHPRDKNGALFHGESQPLQQDRALESYPLARQDDDVCTTEGSTQQISATEELGINSQSTVTHPNKRIIHLRKIKGSRVSALTRTTDASHDASLDIGYGGEQCSDENFEQFLLLRNSVFKRPQDERAVLIDELPSQRNSIDRDYQFSSPQSSHARFCTTF